MHDRLKHKQAEAEMTSNENPGSLIKKSYIDRMQTQVIMASTPTYEM
jgi:hypothetical protein